jgi:hypothetical protein
MKSDDSISKNQSNTDSEMSKHFKKEKPEFQEFLLMLRTLVAGQSKKDSLPRIYNYIKRGFKGNVERKHLDEILQELFGWKDLPRLAMKMAVEASIGRPGGLVERLIALIREELAKTISFPIPRVRNIFDQKMKIDLEDWIAVKSSGGALDPFWARDALICIMRDNMAEDEFMIIHSIIEKCCSKKKKTPTKQQVGLLNKYTNYIRNIGTLFAARQFKPSKLLLALDICKPFSDKLKITKGELEDSNRELQSKNSELLELQKSLKVVNQELAEAHQDIGQLQQEIQSKERALRDEQDRFRMLDEHWRKEVGRESQGKLYAFKEYFEHEIREAKLSLDRESPNAQMALNRILHMEEYLNRIGENT